MNNYLYSTIFIILSFSQIVFNPSFVFIEAATFSQVPNSLEPIVSKLLQLPEADALLEQVSSEGPVSIIMQNDPASQFDAMWNGDARAITVNAYRHSSEGNWICSILFELRNASTNHHMLALFHSAETNQMSKEAWVEQMERMEHANALSTCQLLEKGIALGIYPADARWTIFETFDDYYKLQQITGHSQWLAKKYDKLNPQSRRLPFQGTIANLNRMSSKEKKNLKDHLVMKNKKTGRQAIYY